MSEYARQAALGAEMQTRDLEASTARYRDACQAAAATTDGYDTIRRAVLRELGNHLTPGGAKGNATKVARVAMWLRSGNTWPAGKGLGAAYDLARGASIVCPKCSHSFVP